MTKPIYMNRKQAEEVLKKHLIPKRGQAETHVVLNFLREFGGHEAALKKILDMEVKVR